MDAVATVTLIGYNILISTINVRIKHCIYLIINNMKISKIELEKKEIDHILFMIWKGKKEISLELIFTPFNLSLDLVVNVIVDNTGISDIDPCLDSSKHTYFVASIEALFCVDAEPIDYIELDKNQLISLLNDKL
jgi:hypothetical protein